MLIRKLGTALRGKATPPQILMATILAGMLGFVPGFILPGDLGGGFMQSPALILGLVFLVIVLNANLALFGITLLVAKLLSLVSLGLSFAVGRFLLDGPLQGIFRALINAPISAWFGLERYATSGGLFVGLVFGIVAGIVFLRAMRAYRTRMASLEANSERYQKWSSKRSVRIVTWVLLGKGAGKTSYTELLESKKKGLPVRIGGVIVVAVVVAGLWLAQSFLAGPAFRDAMQGGLERWNGATVDLPTAKLDLAGGQALISGLGMADAQALERDVFAARELDLTISTRSALSKRMVVDRIISREATTGASRTAPGKRINAPPEPPPPPEGPGKTIDDYLADAKKWQERLQQVDKWLRKITGGDGGTAETKEQRNERVRREVEELGLVQVIASHLITEAPMLLVKDLAFDGVKAVSLGGDLLDVHAKNLSTNPGLVPEPLELSVVSRTGKFKFGVQVDAAATKSARLDFALNGIAVDTISAQLTGSPLRGGTVDLSLSGALDCSHADGVRIDLPLMARLRGTTLTIPGMAATVVDDLTVPIGVRGPLASPRLTLDDKVLADALVAAGKKELADQVRKRADELLGGKVPVDIGGVITGEKTPEQLAEEAKKLAEAEAKKAADEAQKKAEAEAKKKLDEELKKRGIPQLPGFPR